MTGGGEMPVAIPQDQTLPSRSGGAGKDPCGRKPMTTTSPARNGRACRSRPRYLPGSRRRASVTYLKSLAAAAVLSVPHLIFPATPANAACETGERIDQRGAELLTARALVSQGTLGGLRVDPCPSREPGEPAGSADIPGGRWGGWSSDRFAQPAGDGSAWTGSTGSRELTGSGRGLVLVSSFLSTAGGSAILAVRSLALDWGPAASTRIALEPGRRDDGLVGPFEAECERSRLRAPAVPSYGVGEGGSSAGYRYELGDPLSGAPPSVRVTLTERFPVRGALGYPSDRPTPTECNRDGIGGPLLQPRRTAAGGSPPMPDPNGEAGTRIEPGAGLGFGPHRPRDPGKASLAHLHAYPGNRIDWSGHGHGRVALSGLCFESERRGPC